ncbi:hypothetical protein PINS_up003207 [Pythium insidiosum]|nr:hypothetical protein PINS_up003207 [Pythium insidiosum]
MALVDVYGDGDSKLIVADADRRLKMYKGSSLFAEQAILGTPSALSYFYSDTARPRVPAIAVASSSFIYIYRNFRPHYKFTIPALEVNSEELRVWESLAKVQRGDPSGVDSAHKSAWFGCEADGEITGATGNR